MASRKPIKAYGIRLVSPDEYEIFHTRESLIPTFLRGLPLLLLAAAVAVGVWFWRHDSQLTWIVAGIGLIIVLLTRIPGIIKAISAKIVVSNERLYLREGFIDIADHYMSLSQISDLHVDPTVLGRMLGYADVSIQSYAGDRDFEMKSVKGAYRLRDALLTRMSGDGSGSQPGQYRQAQHWEQAPGYEATRR